MQTLFETSRSQSVIILALHCIHPNLATPATSGSEFRMCFAGLMENKYLDDNTYTNATWTAAVSLLPLAQTTRWSESFLWRVIIPVIILIRLPKNIQRLGPPQGLGGHEGEGGDTRATAAADPTHTHIPRPRITFLHTTPLRTIGQGG
ncbi:hypothetical protein B0H16DRAFT_132521 [Mycena metata]|uniref:Uncharacterized protein n=1 Tax=Mycena metata TaxID=1033252 RepID=A0AAD7I6S3_9AGAR|nr:hypothetical protein B0H16DRAFT_132521 [Mycena metata]